VSAFDEKLLPRTAKYITTLPGGLDAYPRCRARTTVTREIVEQFPQVLSHPGVDGEVRRRIQQSIDSGEWMPEAEGMAVRMLVRDVVFDKDEDYHRWYFDIAGRVFAKPFYRVLMYVVSPTLVMLGASKRWSAFREGTTLTARVDKTRGDIELSFPDGLYPELTLRGFGEAFRASIIAARARKAEVTLVEATETRGRWTAEWQ